MRLHRSRIRTLMIAVAVAAVVPGVLVERRARFLRLAEYHREMRAAYSDAQADGDSKMIAYHGSAPFTRRQLAHHHLLLARKYTRAAGYPWLPVPPDLPPVHWSFDDNL